jgi:hypothetical protein
MLMVLQMIVMTLILARWILVEMLFSMMEGYWIVMQIASLKQVDALQSQAALMECMIVVALVGMRLMLTVEGVPIQVADLAFTLEMAVKWIMIV